MSGASALACDGGEEAKLKHSVDVSAGLAEERFWSVSSGSWALAAGFGERSNNAWAKIDFSPDKAARSSGPQIDEKKCTNENF